jgi:hypothetical protein
MRDKKLIGGIICLVAAAVIFATDGPPRNSTAGAIAILVVGIALVATSRRGRK